MSLNFLGKGTYGCVVTPGIAKNNEIDEDPNTVSKLFINEIDFSDELKNYDKLVDFIKINQTYDGIYDDENVKIAINKYTIKLLNSSTLKKRDIKKLINPNILFNCKHLHNDDIDIIYQIEYINGGISLRDLFKPQNFEFRKSINLLTFFTTFFNVIKFLDLLSQNKHLHADIKLDNILFDIHNENDNETYFIRVIDFGLLQPHDTIYTYEYMSFLKSGVLYPPEYIFTANFFINPQITDVKYEYFFFMESFKIKLNNIKVNPKINPKIKRAFSDFYKEFKSEFIATNESFQQLYQLFSQSKFTNLTIFTPDDNSGEDSYEDSDENYHESNIVLNNFINGVCDYIPSKVHIDIKDKIDVFMFGSAFLNLLLEIFDSNIDFSFFNNDRNYIFIKKMLNLIFKMVKPNPCERITIAEAYYNYNSIISGFSSF